jgi:hypothetical protein
MPAPVRDYDTPDSILDPPDSGERFDIDLDLELMCAMGYAVAAALGEEEA